MTAAAIGVDIGGTKIAVGVLNGRRRIDVGTLPTVRGDGEANAAAVRELIERVDVPASAPVGLSVTTTLDAQGAFRDNSNWLGWQGWTPAGVLGHGHTGSRTVTAANDALCGAAAEDWASDHPGQGILVYVTLGTGIAHTAVIDGHPLAGANGSALFTSWTPAGAERDGASALTWEERSAGPALARRFDGGRDARPLAAAAAHGDERARDILEEGASWLGVYLATLLQTYDPHRVVIGGGLAAGLPGYVERAIHHARAAVRQPIFRDTPVLPARLGGSSGWVGAALAARTAAFPR